MAGPGRRRAATLDPAVELADEEGDAGTWSLSVSGNWRITFELEHGEVANPDLEDYR